MKHLDGHCQHQGDSRRPCWADVHLTQTDAVTAEPVRAPRPEDSEAPCPVGQSLVSLALLRAQEISSKVATVRSASKALTTMVARRPEPAAITAAREGKCVL